MSLALALAVFAIAAVFAIVAHELGHALAALVLGGTVEGFTLHRAGGVGIRVRLADPRDIRAIAAGGLLATAIVGVVSWSLVPLGGVFVVSAVLNGVLFAVNVIPLGPTDGALILRGAR